MEIIEVIFDDIKKPIDSMSKDQLKITLLTLAIAIRNKEVIDKIDYVNSVKIGLSLPLNVE